MYYTTEEELIEMFGVDGKIPETEPCIEGVDYEGGWFPDDHTFKKGHPGRTKAQGNKGNRYAKGPPKGSKNNGKHYWYKTPTEEGYCFSKEKLLELGFPPSITQRRSANNQHYVGGTSNRNMYLKGYEFKMIT